MSLSAIDFISSEIQKAWAQLIPLSDMRTLPFILRPVWVAYFVTYLTQGNATAVGFEKKEGFSPGSDIATNAGWETSTIGAAEISCEDAEQGSQSLKIFPSAQEQTVIEKSPVSSDKIVFIDFFIKPVADATAIPLYTVDANGAVLGFVKNADQGTVVTVNPHPHDAQAVETGYRFNLKNGNFAADWVRVTIREDLDSKKWDLFLDGKLTLIDQWLNSESLKGFTMLAIYSSQTAPTFVDDLSVSNKNPLFKDSDNDGIPDADEMANGTNAFYGDRDADLNGDGVSNIENFMEGYLFRMQKGSRRKIIYVDNRNGSDALSGELSYRLVKEGPKATLKSAILAADAKTIIAVLPGNQPYTLIEKAKGTADSINIIPLGDISLKTEEK